MRIAILSDSHDQIPNLKRAVLLANSENAELLLHCGDLISPFMLPCLDRFNGPVHLIYGNNPGDQHLIAARCGTLFPRIHHHGTHGSFQVGTLRIALCHYPEQARDLAASGSFTLVCCGHDHIWAVEEVGDCLLINPGDLLGTDVNPAFALLDTGDNSVRRIEVGRQLPQDD